MLLRPLLTQAKIPGTPSAEEFNKSEDAEAKISSNPDGSKSS
jgi:hypothetical protein